MKKQATLFDSNEMPEENWAWVVEVRFAREMLDALGRDPRDPIEWETVRRPNHFRLEQHAVNRVKEVTQEFSRGVKMGLVEFRFSAKYVGYVPPEDETWIQ